MKKLAILFIGIPLLLSTINLYSQDNSVDIFKNDLPRENNKEFQFIAYYINQGVASNFYPENIFIDKEGYIRNILAVVLIGLNMRRTGEGDYF